MNFPMMISKGRVLLWSAAFVLLLTALLTPQTSPAPSSPSSMATRSKSFTIPTLSVSASVVSTALRMVKLTVSERSKPRLLSLW